MAVRIDGKALAVKVKARAAAAAAELPRRPGLAVVLVGEDPASQVYVRGKEVDCAECGIRSFPYRLPAQTTQAELLTLIDRLNRAPEVDGILVQLPLPEPLEEAAVIEAIAPEKDVDCFHPYNVGRRQSGISALHTGRRHGNAAGIRHFPCGEAVRGAGAQQYCRQTHGGVADAGGGDSDAVPL